MFASIVLAAAVALPADGTYSYTITSNGKSVGSSTIVIAPSADGVRAREHFEAGAVAADALHTYDATLHERRYELRTANARLQADISPVAASLTLGGGTTTIPLDHPACALLVDNLLTSIVMLPAALQAGGGHHCVFISPNRAQPIDVDVVTATVSPPPDVPATDAVVTISFMGLTQTFWYDRSTLIPDAVVSGNFLIRLAGHSADTTIAPLPVPAATPSPKSRFPSYDVRFTSHDGSRLAGTFSTPYGHGPFPVVILLQGSGVGDRDETVGPNHIFAELADALNAHGYAVLRYDKRAFGASTSTVFVNDITRGDVVQDGLAAVAFVRARDDVDKQRVFFLGHSEGGEIVMGIALAGAPLRGIIMLAPLPMNYTAMIERQIARNHVSDTDAAHLRSMEKQPYLMSFNAVDPVAEVRKVTIPMLLVHGNEDMHVTDADLHAFIAAGSAAHPKTLTVVELAGDTHIFAVVPRAVAAASTDESTSQALDPRLLEAIARWLEKFNR